MRTLVRIAVLAAGALGAYSIVQARRREEELLANPGSPTNASDVELPEVKPDDDADDVLDVGVEATFPASDPIAVGSAYHNRT
jgi:hypothetical protein